MENDLISRIALIDQLERLAVHEDSWRQSCILGIVRTIDKAPAVDAVEVVRCKDCVYYLKSNRFCCHIDGMSTARDEMSFCSYGERRVDK